MRIQQPLSHWNNFTVPELKEILVHCKALENLGIAQDKEMMVSIERDITIREKIRNRPYESKVSTIETTEKQKRTKATKIKQPQGFLLEQTV